VLIVVYRLRKNEKERANERTVNAIIRRKYTSLYLKVFYETIFVDFFLVDPRSGLSTKIVGTISLPTEDN
jgi:hypothetical protein